MNYKLILKVAGAVAVAVVAVVLCIGCSSDDEEDNYGTIYGTWVHRGHFLDTSIAMTTITTYKRNGTFESSTTFDSVKVDSVKVYSRSRGTYSADGATITTTINDIYHSEITAALAGFSLLFSGPDGPRFSKGWYNRSQYRSVFLEGCETASDYYKDAGVCSNAEQSADEYTTTALGPTTQNYSLDGNTLTICPLDYTNIAQCTDYTRK